ncbi:hypothetical protein ACFYO0_30120 [Streptomyces sp. NPDC006365]|uniref:hypothetical protein n=1 Tax=Streptomyces sp. NPDC006365 TaxID=3364744 RepID=UPI00367B4DD6
MRRKIQLGEGQTERVACASVSAFRGLDTVTGEVLGTQVLAGRVGWLTSLVEELCTQVTSPHWNRPDLARLASGRDCSGARLPSNAWMALRTLGWGASVPDGLYLPDRVRRVAEEQAGRALRSAWWRSEITDAVLATWPVGPDADPLRRTETQWAALRCGKRPAGRMPQSPTHRSQRRGRRQAPHTMSTPTRHQPRGARLGAGFHLHTHATPVTSRARPPGQPRSFSQDRSRAQNPAPPRNT